jgi:hypothetical protein
VNDESKTRALPHLQTDVERVAGHGVLRVAARRVPAVHQAPVSVPLPDVNPAVTVEAEHFSCPAGHDHPMPFYAELVDGRLGMWCTHCWRDGTITRCDPCWP